MSKKIILTGFEPFGGSNINPSIEASRKFDGEIVRDHILKAIEIPLRFKEIKDNVESILVKERPVAVICLGQSPRPMISLERIAINIASIERTSYNCGEKPLDVKLEEEGFDGYFSTLPIRKIKNVLEENKIPCEISNSAGTFGCNQIFYHLMHFINKEKNKIPAGFIHVPSLPEQVIGKNIPSMPLDMIEKALEIIIKTVIDELNR